MGSDKRKDKRAEADELPQHEIVLPTFRIGTYPVTVAEYACAVQAKAIAVPETADTLSWQEQQEHPEYPVACITWWQTRDYAQWLARVTGQEWRLPTEAEWEKAARGTDGRLYPWGDTWDFKRVYTFSGVLDSLISVGCYPNGASPYGVQDLAGIVMQWTSSRFVKRYPYRGAISDDVDSDAGDRVQRSGVYGERDGRAAHRTNSHPQHFSSRLGMRLALSAAVGAEGSGPFP
jgi:formylglycine-generating enzyme required for sulfatase activity